ncbi:MAG: hypothetical protein U0233_10535 [Nitrospira sp.]
MSIWKYMRPLWAMSCMLAIALVLVLPMAPTVAQAGEVTIAAASDLNFAIKEVIEEYEKHSGTQGEAVVRFVGQFLCAVAAGSAV